MASYILVIYLLSGAKMAYPFRFETLRPSMAKVRG